MPVDHRLGSGKERHPQNARDILLQDIKRPTVRVLPKGDIQIHLAPGLQNLTVS